MLLMIPALLSVTLSLSGGVKVGDVVQHQFREAPLNSGGLKSLNDLRGMPVLIDFWGTHCPPCIGAAVPDSIKLQQEYGDDLQVLFVESQGASAPENAAFALKQKWLGGSGMWTIEHPCETGSEFIPCSVLLSCEGRVLFNGSPLDGHKELVRLIEEQIAARRAAPADAPKALKPAWAAYAKGKVGEALKIVDAIAEKDRAALGDGWQSTRDEFLKRTQRSIDRAQADLEHGFPMRCAARLDVLAKSCEGQAELKKSIDDLRAKLAGPEGQAEREAAKVLERLEAAFYEKGGEDAQRKDLERAVAKAGTTKVAERLRGVVAIGAK